jgi:hypothetical protein
MLVNMSQTISTHFTTIDAPTLNWSHMFGLCGTKSLNKLTNKNGHNLSNI